MRDDVQPRGQDIFRMCAIEDFIFRVLKDAASHRRAFQCVSREASAPVQDVDGPVWHLLLCNPPWLKCQCRPYHQMVCEGTRQTTSKRNLAHLFVLSLEFCRTAAWA